MTAIYLFGQKSVRPKVRSGPMSVSAQCQFRPYVSFGPMSVSGLCQSRPNVSLGPNVRFSMRQALVLLSVLCKITYSASCWDWITVWELVSPQLLYDKGKLPDNYYSGSLLTLGGTFSLALSSLSWEYDLYHLLWNITCAVGRWALNYHYHKLSLLARPFVSHRITSSQSRRAPGAEIRRWAQKATEICGKSYYIT